MVVFVKQQARGALVAGIVGYEQVGRIAQENPLPVEGVVLFKDPHHVAIEPSLEPLCLGVSGQLAEIVLIARGLAIVVVLLVKAFAAQRVRQLTDCGWTTL